MYTPRENYIRFFKDEPVQWAPVNTGLKAFMPAFVPENVARGAVAQQEPYTGEYGGPDWFGVNWYFDPVVRGSMETMHLLEDISEWREKVVFPDLDAIDWERYAKENAGYLNTDCLLTTTIYSGFFERLISFVGFEDAAVALFDEEQKEDVHALFSRLTDFYIDYIHRMHKYFNVEYVEVHDDWGTQESLIFSESVHKEMIEPYIRRLVEAVHAEGMIYEQHSCGKIDSLVPRLIEMGVDTWRGQETAVNKYDLVKKYGDRFKFTVEINTSGTMDDEAARRFMYEMLNQYKDYKVCFVFGRKWVGGFTPEQRSMMEKIIKAG